MKKGILYGASTYLMWGFFPLYFKAIQQAPPTQILAHRIVWSLIFLALILTLRGGWNALRAAIKAPRTVAIYALAAVLLAANWLTYIWGVNAGFVVETSLGYFINPLINVLLGVLFLRERMRPMQWLPIGLAAAGVLYLTVSYGQLPWIALALAFSFGLYGLVKKTAPLNSLHGLTLETALLFLPGLAYLSIIEQQGNGAFLHHGISLSLLLLAAGPITAIPLLLFGGAARSIPLSTLGLLQYIAPTCQFLLGVLVFGEPFTPARMIGFGIIWAALALFSLEGFWMRRKLAGTARS